MSPRIATEAERARLRANLARQPELIRVERPAPSTTPEQRLVLARMLDERSRERGRLRVLARDLSAPFNQAHFDLIGREQVMLYVLLGEISRANPRFAEITEAEKKAFWDECKAQFAKAKVTAAKQLNQKPRTYEPRNDPSLAFGD